MRQEGRGIGLFKIKVRATDQMKEKEQLKPMKNPWNFPQTCDDYGFGAQILVEF